MTLCMCQLSAIQRVFVCLDITAVCILEAFANPSSLEMAERVLTQAATLRAKEAFAVRQLLTDHAGTYTLLVLSLRFTFALSLIIM